MLRSLTISGSATLMASAWSIPLAVRLVIGRGSRARRLALDLMNSLTSVPTVVIGLVMYLLLSRSGPLGFLHLLYTPVAIALGQAILVTPLMISTAAAALSGIHEGVWEMARALGATERQAAGVMLREALPSILTVVLLGFNRALGELGIALMLGGNVRGFTRVMTTAIALEVSRGEFELALSLSGILLSLAIVVNMAVRRFGGRG